MVLIVLLKKKDTSREVGITVIIEVNVMEGCPMEIYASIEPFGFSMDVLGSTRRFNTVKKLTVTAFQCILTPSFVTVDIFALVVTYLFSV